jgi:dTDP-D-glucose 4,6-dehydratase
LSVRLLVTGAAGFIGSNFVRYWLDAHPDDAVVAFDLLTYAGNRANLADVEDRITFLEGDIGDQALVEDVLRERGIDVVVNFAAESHNSLAVIDPGRFFRTNAMGTQALLEAARRVGLASTTFPHARCTATFPSTLTTPSPKSRPTGRARRTTRRRRPLTTPCGPITRPTRCL